MSADTTSEELRELHALAPPPAEHEDLGRIIDRAIRERSIVRIEYRTTRTTTLADGTTERREETTMRVVWPQAWLKMDGKWSRDTGNQEWYFIAWCELRKDHRTFMLGRASHKPLADLKPTRAAGPSMWIDHPPAGFLFAASPYPRPNEVDWKDVAADAMREGRTAMALDVYAREDNTMFWRHAVALLDGKRGNSCEPPEDLALAFELGLARSALRDAIALLKAGAALNVPSEANDRLQNEITKLIEVVSRK